MSFLNPNHISSLSHPDNEDPFLSLFCFYNTPSRALYSLLIHHRRRIRSSSRPVDHPLPVHARLSSILPQSCNLQTSHSLPVESIRSSPQGELFKNIPPGTLPSSVVDSSLLLFFRRTNELPPGRTTTYGSVAAHLHTSPRAVGTALSRNPFCPKVPCHRVAAKDGGMGGFLGE